MLIATRLTPCLHSRPLPSLLSPFFMSIGSGETDEERVASPHPRQERTRERSALCGEAYEDVIHRPPFENSNESTELINRHGMRLLAIRRFLFNDPLLVTHFG